MSSIVHRFMPSPSRGHATQTAIASRPHRRRSCQLRRPSTEFATGRAIDNSVRNVPAGPRRTTCAKFAGQRRRWQRRPRCVSDATSMKNCCSSSGDESFWSGLAGIPVFYPSVGVVPSPFGCFEIVKTAPTADRAFGPSGTRARLHNAGPRMTLQSRLIISP
jgi:hypothetical protein